MGLDVQKFFDGDTWIHAGDCKVGCQSRQRTSKSTVKIEVDILMNEVGKALSGSPI